MRKSASCLIVIVSLTAGGCATPRGTLPADVSGLIPPEDPVVHRSVFEEAVGKAPEPRIDLGGTHDFILLRNGEEVSGNWTARATVSGIRDDRLIMQGPQGLRLEIVYRLASGRHQLPLQGGENLKIVHESGSVSGSLKQNLFVEGERGTLVAFIRDGGPRPVARTLAPDLRLVQDQERRAQAGEHNGIREWQLPIQATLDQESILIPPGEEGTIGSGQNPFTIHVLASGSHEVFGPDAERARARMEGPAYFLEVVVYR